MKRIFIIGIAMLTATATFAQIRDYGDYRFVQPNGALDRGTTMTDEQLASIQGSPYDTDAFLLGKVYKDGIIAMDNQMLRYNAFSDHIQTNDGTMKRATGILLKDPGAIVEIMDENYVYMTPNITPGVGGYYKLVSETPKASIYKKIQVKYVPEKKAKNSYDMDQDDKFVRYETLYLVNKDGLFTELGESKGKFAKSFGKDEKDIKKYIKKNNVDLDDNGDLDKLLKYYNSL